MQLSRPATHEYRLITQLHPRNALAEGDRSGAHTVEFILRTDVRGEESVQVVEAREPAVHSQG
jgi:hypothetical protein